MWIVIASGVGLLSWWLTGCLVGGASLLQSIDHPNERSLHLRPTPRTGGVAIVISVLAGLAIAGLISVGAEKDTASPNGHLLEGVWILGSTLFLATISLLDDRGGVSILLRLGLQLLAACGVVFGGEVSFRVMVIPGLEAIELGWVAIPLTLGFMVWMTNLYNFMDGMDGFAGGMTVVGFGLLGYFAWSGHHQLMFGIAAMQMAAAAGFLVHNFPPAKIFMGDVGSISTGFLAGALIVLGCRDGLFDLWVPLVVFSPFILDATFTLVRRLLRGSKVWEAHREHVYQRLVLSGWGHRRTVCAEYAVMVLCGVLAVLYHQAAQWRVVILSAWAIMFSALAIYVWLLEQRVRGSRDDQR